MTLLAAWEPGQGALAQVAPPIRIDLQILVLSAGDSGTAMVKAGLAEGLVPFTEVDLTQTARPVIDAAFLSEVSPAIARAKYQAVVLPNAAPAQLSAAELVALASFERSFKIREFVSYSYPEPSVGLNYPAAPGYVGALDGLTATVTDAARAGAFSYLNGPVTFDDLEPSEVESYGYLATPLPDDSLQQRGFVTLVTLPIPGANGVNGVLLGVYRDAGREQLVMTGAVNSSQFQQQALFPGILEWLTYGVHLGTERNFFAVHVDDVFLADARWSRANNCTVGDDCAATISAPDILMTSADVEYASSWQQQHGLYFDLAFNGGGYDDAIGQGAFPMGDRLLALRSSFRWLSHTYTHLYLGCVQDFSVVPFRCATGAGGETVWATYQEISDEISRNLSFAALHGLTLSAGEIVTGEHSGLRRTPQEPSDNPNLAAALSANGITFLGSDDSRENEQRSLLTARTVPRYPMNIFYNVGTRAEEVDEYNWIYNASADAGSGLCENNPSSTCIAPLDETTGFDAYIVPLEARHALLHALSNSPRPHYAHQSNLAEERILYPVLEAALASYHTTFASSAPLVNATMSQLGLELANQAAWRIAAPRVAAYIEGAQLFLTVESGDAATIPVTLPLGSTAADGVQLPAYAGSNTGWRAAAQGVQAFTLPSTVAYAL